MRSGDLITHLGLQPHPEGGHYAGTYRAATAVDTPQGPRAASTAILYLLRGAEYSAFHRIRSDEAWHWHLGTGLTLHELHPDGTYRTVALGADLAGGQVLQHVVPAGAWFACEVTGGEGYGLVGCTVAPGFDFADFELADGAALAAEYPSRAALLARLAPPR